MPHYSDFTLNDKEIAIIHGVTDDTGSVDWNNKALANIRGRIKGLHLELQSSMCCYCRRSLHGEFAMVIDVEHILPKCTFKGFTFLSVNLSASCKRCNMNIKRARWDFVHGVSAHEMEALVDSSDAYEIIHPNLDVYADHLSRVVAGMDNHLLVKYLTSRATPKGRKTYEFFRLEELEVGCLDKAQGLDGVNVGEWGQRVRELLADA